MKWYKVVFSDKHNNEREVGLGITVEEAHKLIDEFRAERNFHIQYTRGWIDKNGDMCVDVGSHTEHFIIRKVK